MATKVTIDELTMPASACHYAAAGQTLAAGATASSVASGQVNPSIVLPSKANVLITSHGACSLGATTYYARWNIEISNDNATFRTPTTAEYMGAQPGQAWLGVHESVTTSTTEFAGNMSNAGMLTLAAGTWYFRMTHSAALATGTISYDFIMAVAGLSWAA
jgi:hypothetical protein